MEKEIKDYKEENANAEVKFKELEVESESISSETKSLQNYET